MFTFFFTLAIISHLYPTDSQESLQGLIECGETVTGATTSTNPIHNFQLLLPDLNEQYVYNVTVDSCDSSYDTILSFYQTSNGERLGYCDDHDDDCGRACAKNTRARLTIQSDPGNYTIQIGSYSDFFYDDYQLIVTCTIAPSDRFYNVMVSPNPSNDTQWTTTIVKPKQSEAFNLFVTYNIQNYDCVDPRISMQYLPLDYDGSNEYLEIFTPDNELIQHCGGAEPMQCDHYVTCMSNVSLQLPKITMNDTYQISIYQPTSVNTGCSYPNELNATVTLHCSAGTASPTSTTIMPTHMPTSGPTAFTSSPTSYPTITTQTPTSTTSLPTVPPSLGPTVSPTNQPTIPTVQPTAFRDVILCNESAFGTIESGEYMFYQLMVDEDDMMLSFDTCNNDTLFAPDLHLFDENRHYLDGCLGYGNCDEYGYNQSTCLLYPGRPHFNYLSRQSNVYYVALGNHIGSFQLHVACTSYATITHDNDTPKFDNWIDLPNSSMPYPLSGPIVGRDPNNDAIILIGGSAEVRAFSQSIIEYDITSNTFDAQPSVLYGYNQNYNPDECGQRRRRLYNEYEFDPCNAKWFEVYPQAVSQSYVQHDDIIYLLYWDYFGIYNATQRQFQFPWPSVDTELPRDLLFDDTYSALSYFDGYLIVAGGGVVPLEDRRRLGKYDGLYFSNDVAMYNISEDEWLTNVPQMLQERGNFALEISNDYVYAIGGHSIPDTIEKLYMGDIHNIGQEEWQVVQHASSTSLYLSGSFRTIAYDNHIIIIDKIQIYELYTVDDVVSQSGSLSVPSVATAPVLHNDHIYVFGGENTYSGFLDTLQYIALYTNHPTPAPTLPPIDMIWIAPMDNNYFVHDPFIRVELSIRVMLYEYDALESIEWQYRVDQNTWITIDADSEELLISNITSTDNTIFTRLVIASANTANNQYCVNENEAHFLQPGRAYEFRINVIISDEYNASSSIRKLITNQVPSDGYCAIQNIGNLSVLDTFNLYCNEWISDSNSLQYNAMMNGVLLSTEYTDDSSDMKGIMGIGNDIQITVLIKDEYDAISYYKINQSFPSAQNVLSSNNHTTENIMDDVIEFINDRTNNCDQVLPNIVSLYSVIDAMYETTVSTQAMHRLMEWFVQCSSIFIDKEPQSTTTEEPTNPPTAAPTTQACCACQLPRSEAGCPDDLACQVEICSLMDSWCCEVQWDGDCTSLASFICNNNISLTQPTPIPTEITAVEYFDVNVILSEVATLSIVLSNTQLVHPNISVLLVDEYLPDLFEFIDSVYVDTDHKYNIYNLRHELYSIAIEIEILIDKIESLLTNGSAIGLDVDTINHMSNALIDYTTLTSSYALFGSLPGERFQFEYMNYITCGDNRKDKEITHNKTVSSTKFDTTQNDTVICGDGVQRVLVPITFMNANNGYFDCTFGSSTRNNLIAVHNTSLISDLIVADIYTSTNDTVPAKMSHETDKCFPYLITINVNDYYTDILDLISGFKLKRKTKFISCDFWNHDASTWDTTGCALYNISFADDGDKTVTCGCEHLTTFSVSYKDFIPQSNEITIWHWRQINTANLKKYPTVWMTITVMLFVFLFLGLVSPWCRNRESRSMLAYEDVIYKSVRDAKIIHDIAGKEIKYISLLMPNTERLGHGIARLTPNTPSKQRFCSLQCHLFKVYLRNDHTVLAVFARTAGTNFSARERLGCFFMYLCTIMAVTGVFYGVEQKTFIGDITESFIVSLLGTFPTILVKKMFQKSKPQMVKSTKENIMKHDLTELQDTQRTSIITDTRDLKIGEVNNLLLHDSINQNHNLTRIVKLASDIRLIIFNENYPLPSKCNTIAWILLVIWTLGACIVAIIYGIQFDLRYDVTKNTDNPNISKYEEKCWNSDYELLLQSQLSVIELFKAQNSLQSSFVDNFNKLFGFEDDLDSKSWLLSLIGSLLSSIFIWQPLIIYCVTFVKLWMFSWHMKMKIGPGSVCALCSRCCGCRSSKEDKEEDFQNKQLSILVKQLSRAQSKEETEMTMDRSAYVGHNVKFIAHKNRPCDVIGFLSNDDLFIDDYDIEPVDQMKMKKNKYGTVNNESETIELEALKQSV